MSLSAARSTDSRPPRLDRLDHPFVVCSADVHPIAGRNWVPLVGGEGAEQPPGGASCSAAVGPADNALQTMDMEYLAAPLAGGQYRVGSGRGIQHDRAPAGEIPLSGNSLGRVEVESIRSSGGVGHIAPTAAGRTVLAKIDPSFFPSDWSVRLPARGPRTEESSHA